MRVFIPRDAAALAVGADRVAAAIAAQAQARGVALEIIRTGSRGMFWLEPLVEVETPGGRMGYGAVGLRDVPALFDADFQNGGWHEKSTGLVEKIPFFAKQDRLTFARCGVIDPLDLDAYRALGGYDGLARAATGGGANGRGGEGLWPARARGRWFSHGDKMGDGAHRRGGAKICRLQRR